MLKQSFWRSGTAFLTALGIASSASLPVLMSKPAEAQSASYSVSQLFPGQQRRAQTNYGVRIPAGTVIPVRYEKDRVVVTPKETSNLTLEVARNIRSSSGQLLIPAGSEIKGKLRPTGGGTQFVAEELTLTNGRQYSINASSQVVTRRETIRKGANAGRILTGAAIGAGAAAVIAEIFGGIDLGEVLAGAGAGALGGVLTGNRSVEVVVVEPNRDLSLRLNSALALR